MNESATVSNDWVGLPFESNKSAQSGPFALFPSPKISAFCAGPSSKMFSLSMAVASGWLVNRTDTRKIVPSIAMFCVRFFVVIKTVIY